MIETLLPAQFPELLLHTSAPPKKLYFIGDFNCLHRPSVAVVGTRRPTPYGIKWAYQIARDLSKQGVCVVSGLARGIDAAAHWGALEGGTPTAAILGHGLDQIYPREHHGLAQRILSSHGVLVTEYPYGTPPFPRHFPQRNRIIAGLTRATVVIEAALKSGSLITAGFAADEGREVFVIPGRAEDQSFLGSLQLIQDGATMVQSAAEILSNLFGLEMQEIQDPAEKSPCLKSFFEGFDGVVTLGEIRKHRELEKPFRMALSSGSVIECGIQKYCYVGGVSQSPLWPHFD